MPHTVLSHTVLINCITVLYESYSTVKHLIEQTQQTWENTVQLCTYLGKCSILGQIRYSYAENLFKENDSTCVTL